MLSRMIKIEKLYLNMLHVTLPVFYFYSDDVQTGLHVAEM